MRRLIDELDPNIPMSSLPPSDSPRDPDARRQWVRQQRKQTEEQSGELHPLHDEDTVHTEWPEEGHTPGGPRWTTGDDKH